MTMEDDDILALLQKWTYKVRISVGMHHSSLHPVVSTFDSSAGSILVERLLLCHSWKNMYKSRQALFKIGFKSADPLFECTIKRVVLLEDVHARVALGLVDIVFIEILLGRSYTYRFIAGIFLLERRYTPVHSHTVNIFASHSGSKATRAMNTDYNDKNRNDI